MLHLYNWILLLHLPTRIFDNAQQYGGRVRIAEFRAWHGSDFHSVQVGKKIFARVLVRIWQEGNLPGFMSMCMTFPELRIAVVALANEDDRDSSHISMQYGVLDRVTRARGSDEVGATTNWIES